MNNLIETLQGLVKETKLDRPNAKQTWMDLGRQLNDDLFIYGTCLVWKGPGIVGSVREVFRIDPCNVVPQPATPEFPDGCYRVIATAPFIPSPISAADVIRLINPHPMPRLGSGDKT